MKVIPTKEGERISVYISHLSISYCIRTSSETVWFGLVVVFNPPGAGEVVSLPGFHVRACLSRPSIFLQNILTLLFPPIIFELHRSAIVQDLEKVLNY